MDSSDRAAVLLVKKIARKVVEPLTTAARDKTIGQWRQEIHEIHIECVNYVRARHDALGTESDDGQT